MLTATSSIRAKEGFVLACPFALLQPGHRDHPKTMRQTTLLGQSEEANKILDFPTINFSRCCDSKKLFKACLAGKSRSVTTKSQL
jgi:hypothetical protein